MYNPALMRTKADAVDDPDPNTTAPAAAEVVQLRGNRGYRASLQGDAGGNCDVTVWVKNENTGRWVKHATLPDVPPDTMFGDPGPDSGAPDGSMWMQLTGLTGGVEPVSVYVEAW